MKPIALLLSIIVFGCNAKEVSDSEVSTFRLQSTELQLQFSTLAEKEEIWHQRVGDRQIRYRIEDRERVAQLLQRLSDEFLPTDRAVSYAPKLQTIFIDQLKRAGISFREQKHGDANWIIWTQQDAARVNEIQTRLEEMIVKNPELLSE